MRVLRRRDLKPKTGLGMTKIYELIAAGRFPRPIQLGEHAKGWLESEVDAWLQTRVAERDRAA